MGDDVRKPCPGASGIALLLGVLLLVFLLLSLASPVAAGALVMGLAALMAIAILGRAWGRVSRR